MSQINICALHILEVLEGRGEAEFRVDAASLQFFGG